MDCCNATLRGSAPEMTDILFFLTSGYFLQFKFQICAYTQLKSKKIKIIIKNSSMGVRNSTERPKIRRLRRKGYRKN